MSAAHTGGEKPVFSFSFAHYHGPWEWEYVRQILAEKGYDSIAPDLPIEDPALTLDDHAAIHRKAQQDAKQEKGAEKYVEVAHSFSGDIIYRQLGNIPISQMIFIAAPLMPVLKRRGLPEDSPLKNSRTVLYDSFVRYEKQQGGVAEFEPEHIYNTFYNDVTDETLRALAVGQLRQHPHVHQPENDANAVLPSDIPMHYIALRRDNTFKYSSQLLTAQELGIPYSELPTGHFPMLSRPDLLVSELVRIVEVQEKKHMSKALFPQAVLV